MDKKAIADITSGDIEALGVGRDKLKEWVYKGYVPVSVKASGQGTKALFSPNDCYCIKLFDFCLSHGIYREDAAYIIKKVADNLRNPKITAIGKRVEELDYNLDVLVFRNLHKKDAGWFPVYDVEGKNLYLNLSTGETHSIFKTQTKTKRGDFLYSNIIIPQWDLKQHPLKKIDAEGWGSYLIINFKSIRESVDNSLDAHFKNK